MSRLLTRPTLLAAALAVSGLLAVPAAPGAAALSGASRSPVGLRLHVDTTQAATAAAAAPAGSRTAELLGRLAGRPQARWLGEWVPTSQVAAQVADLTTRAAGQGTVAQIVLYAIPHRDCGGESAGGAASVDAYRAWVAQVAAGIGTRPVVVVLEPDALAGMDCLGADRRAERLTLLREAGQRLLTAPRAVVYLDAGNRLWQPPSTMAARLKAAGVGSLRGFALNVSNFDSTSGEVAYGRQVSTALGGKPFVVDTSRNGHGAATGALAWCNPPGRALGRRPTTSTGASGVDAYLWVKRPGESDGACRSGEPRAGAWYQQYALDLAVAAGW